MRKNRIKELKQSNEFIAITGKLFSNEMVIELVVCEVFGLAHLFILTNSRIMLVSKQIEVSFDIKQFGLEEVADLKINTTGEVYDLTIFFKNKNLVKLDYINVEDVNDLANTIYQTQKQWNKDI